MFSFLSNLIFPPSCILCGEFGVPLCSTCLSKLKFAPNQICSSCLKNSLHGLNHLKCKSNINGFIFLFRYEKSMQKIIRQIKYGFYYQSLDPLLKHFLLNLKPNSKFQAFLKTKPTIIPIPIHSKRQKTRGFNQSYVIAKYLAKAWKLPLSRKIIIRTRNTPYQARLTKTQRIKNMQNAFASTNQILKLNPKPLQNENILLVDDVFTTGSTIKECAKIIKKLGARKIWVLTLAHGK